MWHVRYVTTPNLCIFILSVRHRWLRKQNDGASCLVIANDPSPFHSGSPHCITDRQQAVSVATVARGDSEARSLQGHSASAVVADSSRSLGGRLVAESVVFLAMLVASLALFPGWYSVLVALSALLSLYESATSADNATVPAFMARGAFMAPDNGTDAHCQVQQICEMTRLAHGKYPTVATLLQAAARGDYRGGPFVQGILGGLSGVDCAKLFGCAKRPILPGTSLQTL
ncbi:uncharacterized protein LOC144169640 isoform X2 [Haemaphysalis longicornis]